MKAILATLLCMGLLSGLLAGCTNHGLAMRDTENRFGGKTTHTMDRLKERDDYINSNYRTQLATGRAKNEEEARALASSEWERLRHREKLETK